MHNFSVFDHGPRFGLPGTDVTVTGSGFTAATSVAWIANNSEPGRELEVKKLSDAELHFTVPEDAPPGSKFFSVQNPEPGASQLMVFKVIERK